MFWSLLYLMIRSLVRAAPARDDHDLQVEMLVLRKEIEILRRRAGRPKLRRIDKVLLAGLVRALPRECWSCFIVTPETLLRWHRELVRRKWTFKTPRTGRPPVDPKLAGLIVRMGKENPSWGYMRIKGELQKLGCRVSATTVKKVMRTAGLEPAPRRDGSTWSRFIRSQVAAILACDLFTVETVFLQTLYALFFIEVGSRRVHATSSTRHPEAAFVTQQARNLSMAGTSSDVRFLIRDRDPKFTASFDEVFRSEGVRVIMTPVRAPRANAYSERFVLTVRREVTDRIP